MNSAYPDKVWRAFRQPRRAGRLEPGEGVVIGQASTPAGHAELQLHLRLAPDGRIEDARFLALGCPYLIACGDWLCAHLLGRRKAAVSEFDIRPIVEQLGLPAVKRYCAVMARDALHAALAAEPSSIDNDHTTESSQASQHE